MVPEGSDVLPIPVRSGIPNGVGQGRNYSLLQCHIQVSKWQEDAVCHLLLFPESAGNSWWHLLKVGITGRVIHYHPSCDDKWARDYGMPMAISLLVLFLCREYLSPLTYIPDWKQHLSLMSWNGKQQEHLSVTRLCGCKVRFRVKQPDPDDQTHSMPNKSVVRWGSTRHLAREFLSAKVLYYLLRHGHHEWQRPVYTSVSNKNFLSGFRVMWWN